MLHAFYICIFVKRVSDPFIMSMKAKTGSNANPSTQPQPDAPHSIRKPFGDITNVDAIAAEHTPKSPPSSRSRDNPTDVIMLQDDVEFVSDSYSPEPRPGNRRSIVQKVHLHKPFVSFTFFSFTIFNFTDTFFYLYMFLEISTQSYTKVAQEA